MNRTSAIKLGNKDCVLTTVPIRRNGAKEMCTVWLTPSGQRRQMRGACPVFETEELYIFSRQEDMYGIPNALKDTKIVAIMGRANLPTRVDKSWEKTAVKKPTVRNPRPSIPVNPVSPEAMAEFGQTVIFNVRSSISGKGYSTNPMLIKLLCSMIIEGLQPLEQDTYIPDKSRVALDEYMKKFDLPEGRLGRVIDSLESCFRMSATIIPPRLLGAVFYESSKQTLQFMTQGLFSDEDKEGVTYFDDVKGTAPEQVLIKHISDPDTVRAMQEKNRAMVEEGDAYMMDSIRQEEELAINK